MKLFKIILILVINIFIILLIFAFLEYKTVQKLHTEGISWEDYKNVIMNGISVDDYFNAMLKRDEKFFEDRLYFYHNSFRKDENINSKEKPIVIFGCSFAYGTGLKEDETFSAKIAKLTGHPTYNRACSGCGLAQFLYLSRCDNFYNYIKQEPEYAIYIYINDHKNRLDKFKIIPQVQVFQPKYKVKNNHLKEQKPKIFDNLYFFEDFQYNYNYWFNRVTPELVKLYFTETEAAIRKHWKNTKLIILVYPTIDTHMDFSDEYWTKLEQDTSYKVILIKNLTDVNLIDEKYKLDGEHPTAECWDILVPKIINAIGIK